MVLQVRIQTLDDLIRNFQEHLGVSLVNPILLTPII